MLQKVGNGLKRCVDCLIRWILMGLIRIAFRPKIYYATPKAKEEALKVPMLISAIMCGEWTVR